MPMESFLTPVKDENEALDSNGVLVNIRNFSDEVSSGVTFEPAPLRDMHLLAFSEQH